MTTNAVIERDATTGDSAADTASNNAFVEFLHSEFPAWTIELENTETWGGDTRPVWLATQPDHHPQSALTAGKLHRRLSDYEARIAARHPDAN
jgi:hypothetical protein